MVWWLVKLVPGIETSGWWLVKLVPGIETSGWWLVKLVPGIETNGLVVSKASTWYRDQWFGG